MGIIITAESIAVTVDFSAADPKRLSFEECILFEGQPFYAPRKIGLPHIKNLGYRLFIEMGKHIEIQCVSEWEQRQLSIKIQRFLEVCMADQFVERSLEEIRF